MISKVNIKLTMGKSLLKIIFGAGKLETLKISSNINIHASSQFDILKKYGPIIFLVCAFFTSYVS